MPLTSMTPRWKVKSSSRNDAEVFGLGCGVHVGDELLEAFVGIGVEGAAGQAARDRFELGAGDLGLRDLLVGVARDEGALMAHVGDAAPRGRAA